MPELCLKFCLKFGAELLYYSRPIFTMWISNNEDCSQPKVFCAIEWSPLYKRSIPLNDALLAPLTYRTALGAVKRQIVTKSGDEIK